MMRLWLVTADFEKMPDSLYERALLLVDPDSQARIRRFYHRADAWRTLIGRLLPRMMLRQQGVPVHAMAFGATAAGKPYIAEGVLDPPIAFNVSHDGAVVALAFCPAPAPAHGVGVDVMRVRLPPRETLDAFIAVFTEQLSPLERAQLAAAPAPGARLAHFFRLWTLKEAYTKALGLGLGFDFARLSYDARARALCADGAPARGWALVAFAHTAPVDEPGGAPGEYVGVVAERGGGEDAAVLREAEEGAGWIERFDAEAFVRRALEELA